MAALKEVKAKLLTVLRDELKAEGFTWLGSQGYFYRDTGLIEERIKVSFLWMKLKYYSINVYATLRHKQIEGMIEMYLNTKIPVYITTAGDKIESHGETGWYLFEPEDYDVLLRALKEAIREAKLYLSRNASTEQILEKLMGWIDHPFPLPEWGQRAIVGAYLLLKKDVFEEIVAKFNGIYNVDEVTATRQPYINYIKAYKEFLLIAAKLRELL
jgi:hypothetical protein